LWRGVGLGRDLFALLADDGDRPPDLDLSLLHGDLEKHPGRVRLDLLGDLVGVELVQRLALLDRVALGLEPLDDRPGLHALPEPGKLDVSCHDRRGSIAALLGREHQATQGRRECPCW
jgi:hypothetical protein